MLLKPREHVPDKIVIMFSPRGRGISSRKIDFSVSFLVRFRGIVFVKIRDTGVLSSKKFLMILKLI